MNMTILPDVPDDFQPTYLDLVLATLAAIGLPFAAGFIFNVTGALIPLIIYYGVFCWAIVRWRRGAVGYEINRGEIRKQFAGYVSSVFLVILILQLILIGFEFITVQRVSDFNLLGFILTLVIWAPLNAFSEQLIWIYTFDSYAEFFKEGPKRKGMIAIGGLLYIVLISLIHLLFWILVLPEGQYVFPFSELFVPIQTVIAIGYIFLYRRSKSMWPLGIIHVLINIAAIALSGYSIIPVLLVFS
ncbi:MAG: hypothetical protein JSW05_03320 [Candidatus Thorarchaeota archaeon]|nr:MAG: hypothetical protein JSW05_03320 [Candidatus Thorarchaeota archaeon]